MAEIEKESTDKTGLRSDVVTLYQGGQYHLYTYKKYTDVRLVFAPEFAAAFFGGDPDNFEYPRYDLDVCFFRAYENGRPVRPEHYLKWSKTGAKEGDLVFVAGHPGRTNRLNTVGQPEYLRDVIVPTLLDYLQNKEAFLLEYGKTSPEACRHSKEELFSVQNSRKARIGGLGGLRDSAFMSRKAQAEHELRSRIDARPRETRGLRRGLGRIGQSEKVAAEITKPLLLPVARLRVRLRALHDRPAPRSAGRREGKAQFGTAQGVSRLGPAIARARALFRSPDLPRVRGGQARSRARPTGRSRCPMIRWSNACFEAERPRRRQGSSCAAASWPMSPSVRKLAEGGKAAIESCDDPMIKLALAVDADARAVRKRHEDEVEGVQASNYALIARAMFEEKGDSIYPDATFTLRLAFGTSRDTSSTARRFPPTPRSAARSSMPRLTATKIRTSCRRHGSRPKVRQL